MYNTISQLHTALFLYLHSLAVSSRLVTDVVFFCARYLDMLVIGVVIVFLLFHRHANDRGVRTFTLFWRQIKEIVLVFATSVIAWLAAVLLKMNIESARPYIALSVDPLFIYGGLDSFPSGHATFFMALSVAVWFHHRSVGYTVGICAVLIGLGRVMAGIHYPIDVLFGWLLGAFLAIVVYRLWLRIRRWYFGNRT